MTFPRRLILATATVALVAAASLVPPAAVSPLGPNAADAQGGVPRFTLPAAIGGPSRTPFNMGQFLGRQPVIVLFWATWCSPCLQELPFYQSLYQRYQSEGLKIVGISMDSQATVNQAGPHARRLGLTFDIVTDVSTVVIRQINPRRAAPYSIWVNHSGQTVWTNEGYSPAENGTIARRVESDLMAPYRASR